MDYGRIRGISLPVSRLVQGTLHLNEEGTTEAGPLFDGVYEAGCNAFDTAVVYGRGNPERALGEWMEDRGVRASVVVIDKGCHPLHWMPRMTPRDLESDLLGSLERLRTDYIDLYLLHRDDPSVPVDEIITALNEQVAAGRIRAFGASNWTRARLEEADEFARRRGLQSFAASSPGLSLANPIKTWPGCVSIALPRDRGDVDWYRASGLPVLAWSPLAGGFLSGRFTPHNADSFTDPGERQALEFYGSEENYQRLERLREVAARRAITVAQAALAYVLSAPMDVYAVVGCRTREEFTPCVEVLRTRLTDAEMSYLELGESAGQRALSRNAQTPPDKL